MEKYEWTRIHKTEEHYERQIMDDVNQHICDWFGVDYVEDLTKEQIEEVIAFRDSLNEYSVMQLGFSEAINAWECSGE